MPNDSLLWVTPTKSEEMVALTRRIRGTADAIENFTAFSHTKSRDEAQTQPTAANLWVLKAGDLKKS